MRVPISPDKSYAPMVREKTHEDAKGAELVDWHYLRATSQRMSRRTSNSTRHSFVTMISNSANPQVNVREFGVLTFAIESFQDPIFQHHAVPDHLIGPDRCETMLEV